MEVAFEAARVVSIVAFLSFGAHCLAADTMRTEFERYGLAPLRRLTGWLEIAGGVGLVASYWIPPLAVAAATGLAMLMLLGTLARIRIRDPLLAMLPALFLLLLNAWLAIHAFGLSASRG